MDAVTFAAVAREITGAARAHGLETTSFRCPPHRPGVTRSIRRREKGGFVVCVQIKDRSDHDVAVDMVDGVLVANAVPAGDRPALRDALLDVLPFAAA